jgi:hypothetical protein
MLVFDHASDTCPNACYFRGNRHLHFYVEAGDRKTTRGPCVENRNKTADSLSRHASHGSAQSVVPIGGLGEAIQRAAKQNGLLRRYRSSQ